MDKEEKQVVIKEKEEKHKEEEEMRKLGKRSSDAKKCG